jgi:TPR repeat protein
MNFFIRSLLGLILFFWLSNSAQQSQIDELIDLPQEFDEQRLLRRANNNDPQAMRDVGLRLFFGRGLNQDAAKGIEWLTKAANLQHSNAMLWLGLIHQDHQNDDETKPINGYVKDNSIAADWFRKAAQLGNDFAQFELSKCYLLGRGIEENKPAAVSWLKKSADQGLNLAQYLLARCLLIGEGTEKKPETAAIYFLKAAQGGNFDSMKDLAQLYYTGNGVEQDYYKSGAWFRRAAANSNTWSYNNFAWFLATCPEEACRNPKSAVDVAKLAVENMRHSEDTQESCEIIDTMAASLASASDFVGAVAWQKKAVKILEAQPVKEDNPTAKYDRAEKEKILSEFKARVKLFSEQLLYIEHPPVPEKAYPPLVQDLILDEDDIKKKSATPKEKKPLEDSVF